MIDNNLGRKEEILIQHLETISPKKLLEELSSGNKASEQELKMISEIMIEQLLPLPVMNVLVHYVLLQSNMKLSKNYLMKVASHWSRAGLKTAREAMVFAKQEVLSSKSVKVKQELSESMKEKPFTLFEYRYMEKLYEEYDMSLDVSREIIFYGRVVNQGLMLYWFLDAVSNYVNSHKIKTASDTKDLLKVFHDKFVLDFGKER